MGVAERMWAREKTYEKKRTKTKLAMKDLEEAEVKEISFDKMSVIVYFTILKNIFLKRKHKSKAEKYCFISGELKWLRTSKQQCSTCSWLCRASDCAQTQED